MRIENLLNPISPPSGLHARSAQTAPVQLPSFFSIGSGCIQNPDQREPPSHDTSLFKGPHEIARPQPRTARPAQRIASPTDRTISAKQVWSNLIERRDISQTQRRFECSICGSSFSRKENCQLHLLCHAAQPVLCDGRSAGGPATAVYRALGGRRLRGNDPEAGSRGQTQSNKNKNENNGNRKNSKKEDDAELKGISLSGLLNVIDGVAASEGRILVMTTNHAETLDLRRATRTLILPSSFPGLSGIRTPFSK
ncbi:hypothetical protein FE257_003842 [Aspergillus nanangensis]|uniref:C2H2-type domain-containing protein n=1 Tax=Aspergillus nanangensis TaxID=2582783 RepID=A0AAD4CB51_ASPNN|nr:hypothetical protein FE257_003842 [Aspergillus nanangensis]